jgi:hypothetical protein
MADLKALCMKCRDANNKPTMQDMKDPVVSKNDKGRYMARGKCAVCGGNTFAFLGEEKAKTMM